MPNELEVLLLVFRRLNSKKIDYMLTGSMALNYYVVPRMTRDIDIVIALPANQLMDVYNLFKGDFYIDFESMKIALLHQKMFNIIFNPFIVKVDFIIKKDQAFRESEFNRRVKIKMEGVPTWIVSKEDLIISKLYWAKDSLSEMQLNDVRLMLKKLDHLDYVYIQHWVSQLGLNSIYSKVAHE